MEAAFAESSHGILSGMTKRPRSQAGPPMTLGNMRANGVRSLAVSCHLCHHEAVLGADRWPDHVVRAAHGVPPRRIIHSGSGAPPAHVADLHSLALEAASRSDNRVIVLASLRVGCDG
jgi:hypothetical protein